MLDSIAASLTDGAASQVRPGEIAEYTVVRVLDEVLVDLMKSGCGVTYEEAIQDAVTKDIHGVHVPVASQRVMWKMKQTLREKDISDKIFLRQWAEDNHVQLDPSPTPPEHPAPPWVEKIISWLRRTFGSK